MLALVEVELHLKVSLSVFRPAQIGHRNLELTAA